jgi:pilus assembly protein CpaB
MNITRLIVILVAGLAAVAAAFFVRGTMQAAPQPVESSPVEAAIPVVQPEKILIAARDIGPGHRLTELDLRWANWPKEALLPTHIVQARDGEAIERLIDGIARNEFISGEPLNEQRIVQSGDAGFMAAVLQPGMRAVAVPTSARAGAGGFILPNDRVDILASYEEDRSFRTNIIVENARVLAIDQSFSESDDGAVVGSTATIELTSEQARVVARAVAIGSISLALRSVADGEGGPRLPGATDSNAAPTGHVRVFRYGQEENVALMGGRL